jgi:hypothetical protein
LWVSDIGEEYGRYISGKYVQVRERNVEGLTVGTMYRRGVQRVRKKALCTGEECEGYDNGQYVQEE